MISRTKEMIPLASNFSPGSCDVICSKGKEAKQHPANQWLRRLIKENLEEYSRCPSKLERSFIVSRIMRTIRDASPDGGFVRNLNGVWHEVGDRNAREKIGQAFRDLLHTKYKSSTKAKASIRRKRASQDSGSLSCNTSHSGSSCKVQPDCPTSVSPSSAKFPITEVSFGGPMEKEIELDTKDFEPLPLSQGLKFDMSFTSADGSESSDDTFEEAMRGLYDSFERDNHQSKVSLATTTVFQPQQSLSMMTMMMGFGGAHAVSKPCELVYGLSYSSLPQHYGVKEASSRPTLKDFFALTVNQGPTN
jgi:hypothetical protein